MPAVVTAQLAKAGTPLVVMTSILLIAGLTTKTSDCARAAVAAGPTRKNAAAHTAAVAGPHFRIFVLVRFIECALCVVVCGVPVAIAHIALPARRVGRG